jgi:hypothetical protein
MEKLDVSRDHPELPSQAASASASGHTKPESGQHGHSGDQARTSSQHSERGALKTSQGEVWYLKTIEFTSPSGVRRKYNIITQNYNGCVLALAILSSVLIHMMR